MTELGPEERARVDDLLGRAVEQPRATRIDWVRGQAGIDERVRAEVISLLRHVEDGLESTFMESPARLPHDDAAPDAPPPPPPNIEGYLIRGVIAEGGMGTVYLAEQERPRRDVALKVLRVAMSTPSVLRRFQHEAEILARLQHAGIAQVYDAGTHDEGAGARPWFAMELIRGTPLDRYATECRLDVCQRLHLIFRVCQAVHHAHLNGVIHRDLKPANIIVDMNGQPKVVDFGVARLMDTEVPAVTLGTNAGELLGTIPYMSPEQVAAEPANIDVRSDVYAMGVVAHELLTGQLPYDVRGKAIHEAVRAISEDVPPPLRALDPKLRGDVEVIVAKALEKDRARRYQSAQELADDLWRHLSDEPIEARLDSGTYVLRKMLWRYRGVAAVALALVLLTFGFAVTMTVMYRRAVAAEESKTQTLELTYQMFDEVDVRRFVDVRLRAGLPSERSPLLERVLANIAFSLFAESQGHVDPAVAAVLFAQHQARIEAVASRGDLPTDERLGLAWAHLLRSRHFARRGQIAAARDEARSAWHVAAIFDTEAPAPPEAHAAWMWSRIALGDIELDAGRIAIGRDHLERARDHCLSCLAGDDPSRYRHLEARIREGLGRAALLSGDHAGAREEFELMRQAAKLAGLKDLEAHADLHFGDLALQAGEPKDAKRRYERSMEIATQLSAAAPRDAHYRADVIDAHIRLAVARLQLDEESRAADYVADLLGLVADLEAMRSDNPRHVERRARTSDLCVELADRGFNLSSEDDHRALALSSWRELTERREVLVAWDLGYAAALEVALDRAGAVKALRRALDRIPPEQDGTRHIRTSIETEIRRLRDEIATQE